MVVEGDSCVVGSGGVEGGRRVETLVWRQLYFILCGLGGAMLSVFSDTQLKLLLLVQCMNEEVG